MAIFKVDCAVGNASPNLRRCLVDVFVRLHIHLVEVYGVRTEDEVVQH